MLAISDILYGCREVDILEDKIICEAKGIRYCYLLHQEKTSSIAIPCHRIDQRPVFYQTSCARLDCEIIGGGFLMKVLDYAELRRVLRTTSPWLRHHRGLKEWHHTEW
jgi:hypothetical protein